MDDKHAFNKRALARIATMSAREFDAISAMDTEEYYEYERKRLQARHVSDRQAHRFSDSIGGDSSNYRSPWFGGSR